MPFDKKHLLGPAPQDRVYDPCEPLKLGQLIARDIPCTELEVDVVKIHPPHALAQGLAAPDFLQCIASLDPLNGWGRQRLIDVLVGGGAVIDDVLFARNGDARRWQIDENDPVPPISLTIELPIVEKHHLPARSVASIAAQNPPIIVELRYHFLTIGAGKNVHGDAIPATIGTYITEFAEALGLVMPNDGAALLFDNDATVGFFDDGALTTGLHSLPALFLNIVQSATTGLSGLRAPVARLIGSGAIALLPFLVGALAILALPLVLIGFGAVALLPLLIGPLAILALPLLLIGLGTIALLPVLVGALAILALPLVLIGFGAVALLPLLIGPLAILALPLLLIGLGTIALLPLLIGALAILALPLFLIGFGAIALLPVLIGALAILALPLLLIGLGTIALLPFLISPLAILALPLFLIGFGAVALLPILISPLAILSLLLFRIGLGAFALLPVLFHAFLRCATRGLLLFPFLPLRRSLVLTLAALSLARLLVLRFCLFSALLCLG